MRRDGSNYLNASLNLDDVYSVISKDIPLTSLANDAGDVSESNDNVIEIVTDHSTASYLQPVANETNQIPSSLHYQKLVTDQTSDPEITPVPSPTDSSATSDRDRGTPSPPAHDSGIESDNSPYSYTKTSDVSKVRHIF